VAYDIIKNNCGPSQNLRKKRIMRFFCKSRFSARFPTAISQSNQPLVHLDQELQKIKTTDKTLETSKQSIQPVRCNIACRPWKISTHLFALYIPKWNC